MISLLLAGAVAGAPAERTATETPNAYTVPAHCGDTRRRVVDKYGRPLPLRLGDLPEMAPMLLVDRTVNGCPVITLMRQGLAPAPDQPNPPPSAYRYQPLQPSRPK